MIKRLNNNEIDYVSGGWTCLSTYEGNPFLMATWISKSNGEEFGFCHYGSKEGDSAYMTPKNVIEIVQKPMNFWTFSGSPDGTSAKYACREKNVNKCVFESK